MTRYRVGAGEVGRFAVTGGAAYLVDMLVFNLLSAATGHIAAKVISSIAAIAVAYLGSRHHTWPTHRPATRHPLLVFVLVSAVAAGVQLVCLWLSHDVIGWTGVLADNISANLIGMGLATALRFWGFRTFVFRGQPATFPRWACVADALPHNEGTDRSAPEWGRKGRGPCAYWWWRMSPTSPNRCAEA